MELLFDGGVPMMDGTWYNPETGDSFTVRDSFFQDNNYIIMTTDGRQLSPAQITKYIKSDIPIRKQEKAPKQADSNVPVPATYDDLITADDIKMLNGMRPSAQPDECVLTEGLGRFENEPKTRESTNIEYQILDKAFNKKHLPELTVLVTWKDFPAKKIDMLKTMMDITDRDITDYVMNNITISNVREIAEAEVMRFLSSKCDSEEAEAEDSDKIKQVKPAHKPASKKTKAKQTHSK